jgi:hypothetical protein
MIAGAVGAIGFFFFKVPASYAGLGSFTLAGLAMVIGSLLGKKADFESSRLAGESPLDAWVKPA